MTTPALALVALVLCQSTTPTLSGRDTPAMDRAGQAAFGVYANCLSAMAAKFDDHISDADTIATAIEGTCNDELIAAAKAWSVGATGELAQVHLEALQSRKHHTALLAVLAGRRQHPSN
jgi:hypothetical protein